MLRDFREFITRGNVMDLAVAIIIGAAFTLIVNSLVNDVIMPPVGMLLGGVDFRDLFVVLKEGAPVGPYPTLEAAQAAGAVTLRYGMFANTVVNFTIVAFAIFVIVRASKRMARKQQVKAVVSAAASRPCPFCRLDVPSEATRCPHCTSQLAESAI
jgi:large conductance mechanosensitive channel